MSEQVMTVTTAVSAAGQVWEPGKPVTSKRALQRISDDKLVPLGSGGKHAEDDAQSAEDGEGWYNHRTVKTVLDGVGSDVDRAGYALERERNRSKPRQRVLDALIPMALAGEDDDQDDAGEDDEAPDDAEG